MSDAFFAGSNSKKRKRAHASGVSFPKKAAKRSPGVAASSSSKPRGVKNTQKNGLANTLQHSVPKRREDEIESDPDAEGGVDFDEDLQASEIDEAEMRERAYIEDDEDESPAEKRLRLAKLYLESVKNGIADGEWDAAEIDREIIQARLQKDVLEHSGNVHFFIMERILDPSSSKKLVLRPHRLSVTAAVVSEDLKTLFTSGKEGNIIKHNLLSGQSQKVFYKHVTPKHQRKNRKDKGKTPLMQQDVKGHLDEVWALALSPDGRWLASGGKDRRVCVWDVHRERWVKSIGKHKDSVSGVAFRKGTQNGHSLYSVSFDRTVQVFTLPTSPPSASGSADGAFGYVETLFGHQDKITGLDSLRAETAVSSGGRDKSVRFFKIADETQLVFRGGVKSALREVIEGGLDADADMDIVDRKGKGKGKQKFVEGSMECVAMIDEHTFVSGGDSGSISLWSTGKKKPVFNYPLAHGVHIHESETEGQVKVPRWVTSLACLRYSDLFASGSHDGHIRLWGLDPKLRSFQALPFSISVPGIINSLQLVSVPHTHNPLLDATWLRPREINETQINAGELEGEFVALLVAGVGKEPRLGRWLTVNTGGAKNCALVIPLRATKS